MPLRLLIAIGLAAEVVATVYVAQQIGVLATFAWWALTFVLGILVIRFAGARAWAGLTGAFRGAAVRPGQTQPREVLDRVAPGDTALLFLAGLLLAIPGVLTDLIGLVLLLPLSRKVVKSRVARKVDGRFTDGHFTVAHGTIITTGTIEDPVVQAGEAVEEDERPRPEDEDRPGPGPLPQN